MAQLENTGSYIRPTSTQENSSCANLPPLIALPMPALRSSHSKFMHLAPETRNAIYGMVFDSPLPFFIVAEDGISPGCRLRERSDQSQHNVLHTLQALSMVSKEIRREARTLFYAEKHFLILPYGYEYLSVFLYWLTAIGPDCRAVLRNVCFAGYMWYQGSAALTQQFHGLLRSCSSLRVLTVQLNVWHLCAACIPDLDRFLNFEGPEPHDGPMPEVDIAAWADTITQLSRLRTFSLDIVMSIDRSRKSVVPELNYLYFITERCRALAENVGKRLRKDLYGRDRGDIEMTVRFGGTDKRVYFARPWRDESRGRDTCSRTEI
jgi:hypothetical protein